MGFFKWFSSDEIEFLVKTFDITLPAIDGKLSVLNDVQQLRSKLDQQKLILQNYYTHPLLENDQVPIKNALKNYVLHALEQVDDFLKKMESDTKQDPAKLQATLKKSYSRASTSIEEAQKKLDELKVKQKILNSLQTTTIKERNAFITLLQDTKTIHLAIADILQGEVIKPRAEDLKDLRTASEMAPTFSTIEVSPESRQIITATVQQFSETELESFRSAIAGHRSTIVALQQRLSDALKQWHKGISDVLPAIDFPWNNTKSIYKNYEKLRSEIRSSNMLSDEEKSNVLTELDQAYLVPFLAKEQDVAARGFQRQLESWTHRQTTLKNIRDKAEKEVENVRTRISKLISVMTPDEIQTYNANYNEIKQHLGDSLYKESWLLCQKLLEDIEGNASLNDRATNLETAKTEWSSAKVLELGTKIQDLQQKALLFEIQLPSPKLSLMGIPEAFQQNMLSPSEYISQMNTQQAQYDTQHEYVNKRLHELGKDELGLKINDEHTILTNTQKETKENKSKGAKKEQDIKKFEAKIAKLAKSLRGLQDSEKELENHLKTPNVENLDDKQKKRYKKILKKTQKKLKEKYLELQSLTLKKTSAEQELTNIQNEQVQLENALESSNQKIQQYKEQLRENALDRLPQDKVNEWTAVVNKFSEEYVRQKTSLEDKSAAAHEQSLLAPFQTRFDVAKKEWEQIIKKSVTAEELAPHINGAKQIVDELHNLTITQEGVEQLNTNAKKDELSQRKMVAISSIQEMEKMEPTSSASNETLYRKPINATSSIEDLEVLITNITTELTATKARHNTRTGLLQELITQRNRIKEELTVRLDIRKNISTVTKKISSHEKCLDMAYSSVTAELNVYTDAYLNSLVTVQTLLDSTKAELTTIHKTLKDIDSVTSTGIVATIEKLRTDRKEYKKRLTKDKILRTRMPKRYESLLKEINDIKSNMAKQSPQTSKKSFANWKIVYESYSTESVLLDADIKELLNAISTMRSDVKKSKKVFLAYPKVYAKLKNDLKAIKASCATMSAYNVAKPRFADLQDLYQDCLANPQVGAKAESDEGSREEALARLKLEWEALFKEFKTRNVPALDKLIKKQQKVLDRKDELKRLSDASSKAHKEFAQAEKAGSKEQYEEARGHLKEIRRIHAHLKRFPNGVNAHRMDGLRKISTGWKESISTFHTSLDSLTATIDGAVPESQIVLKPAVLELIREFKEGFVPGVFDIAIAKLLQRNEIPKWKEVGLSLVRDHKALIKSEKAKLMQNNPFQAVSTKILEKQLNSIEKTFLLFK